VTARDIELCKELIEELQHVTANKRSMHGVMLLEYNKASLLLRLGDNDAAEAGFKLVRSILSEYSDLIRKSFSRFDSGSSFYLGEIAKKRGQNKLAKEYFAKAIETVPNHRMANAALASCS
jgi:TolA-binding protein